MGVHASSLHSGHRVLTGDGQVDHLPSESRTLAIDIKRGPLISCWLYQLEIEPHKAVPDRVTSFILYLVCISCMQVRLKSPYARMET